MAVTVASKANKVQATNFTSLATISITPTANKLLMATVTTRQAAGTPQLPTMTGNSITWAQLDTFAVGGRRQTIFTAFAPSPVAGAVTADFSAVTQSTGSLIIDEFTGARFSYGNNGIDCVQNITHNNVASGPLSLTVTLPDFHSTNNATYGAFCHSAGAAATAGSGFTIVTNSGNVGGFITATTEFVGTNDTTVDTSYPTTSNMQAIGMEIIAATPSGFFMGA
jgi:hypothetical protein